MIPTELHDGFWGGMSATLLDLLVKATILCLAALSAHALLGPRRALQRSAIWNACVAGLLVLPLAALLFPRQPIEWLPPVDSSRERVVDPPGGPAPVVETAGPAGRDRPAFVGGRSSAAAHAPAAPSAGSDAAAVPRQGRPAAARVDRPSRAQAESARVANSRGWWSEWRAWACIAYAAGGLLLLIRLIGSMHSVRVLRRTAIVVNDPGWSHELERAQRRLGLSRAVPLARSDGVTVPVMIGWRRPMILLPGAMAAGAPAEHRGGVLLHELAHVQRGDGLWLLLVRLAQALYWPHPLVWLAARLIAVVREQACDDVCVHHGAGPEQYRATLLNVAGLLARRPPAALGIAMARSPKLAARLARIDAGRGAARCTPPLRWRAAALSLAMLAAVGIGPLGLSHRRVAAHAQPPESVAGRAMTVRVIERGTNKPIAGAAVRVRDRRQGREAGVTGADGVLPLPAPLRSPNSYCVSAFRDGFAPLARIWRSERGAVELPTECVLELERGTVIGGVVQDESGRPVAGVRVHAIRLGPDSDWETYDHHPVLTDDQGRWRCDHMPATLDRLLLYTVHDDFVSDEQEVRAGGEGGPSEGDLRAQTAVVVVRKGLAVSGRVTDSSGRGVAGATVSLGPVAALHCPTVRSGADGSFVFPQVRAGIRTLAVAAAGFAPDFRKVTISPGLQPIAVQLRPASVIRGRVVDGAGRPIAGAWVAVEGWGGERDVLEWWSDTDEQGRFAWNDAPPEPVSFSIGRAGYFTARGVTLPPSGEETVVPLHRGVLVRGTVVDARTGQPLDRFSVSPGRRFRNAESFRWDRPKACEGGRFELLFDEPADGYCVRVEARGYQSAVSRAFSDAQDVVAVDLSLERTRGVGGIVRSPDGRPVAGAEVGVCRTAVDGLFAGVMLLNGKVLQWFTTERATTDADGRYWFAPQQGPFVVAVIHDAGHAEVSEADLRNSGDIRLEPWSRIEGALRSGSRPAAREKIVVSWDRLQPGRDVVQYRCETRTDVQGRFVLDRVPSGEGRIRHEPRFAEHRGYSLECAGEGVPFVMTAGQTLRVDLGGSGRPVVGRVTAKEKIDWAYATGWLMDARRNVMEGRPRAPWQYQFRIEQDGTFRAEDIPAGDYKLSIELRDVGAAGSCGDESVLARAARALTIPDMPGGRSDAPLDVGELRLESVTRPEGGPG